MRKFFSKFFSLAICTELLNARPEVLTKTKDNLSDIDSDVIYSVDYLDIDSDNENFPQNNVDTIDYKILSQVEFLQSFVDSSDLESSSGDNSNFADEISENENLSSTNIIQEIQKDLNTEEKVEHSGLTTWRYKGPGFLSPENEFIKVKKNQPIFELHDVYEKYILSFDMEVHGSGNEKHWRSLLQFSPILNSNVMEDSESEGSTGNSYSTSSIDHSMIPFEGYPGLWIHRGSSTDLLLIVSCNNKYYRKIRIDTNFNLNEKNNVMIKVYKDRGNGKIKIYLNGAFTGLHYGAHVCEFSDFIEAMNIYAGNPWHDVANATLSNIRYEAFW